MLVLLMLRVISAVDAQRIQVTEDGFNKKTTINGKTYKVAYYEHEVDADVEQVWKELINNFAEIGEVMEHIIESYNYDEAITYGVGQIRVCVTKDEKGKQVIFKEKIIEVIEKEGYKEYFYHIYDVEGTKAPADLYGSWLTKKGDDGKTYIGSAIYVRGKPALLFSGLVLKKVSQGIDGPVLAYKHFFETGKKEVPQEKLRALYITD